MAKGFITLKLFDILEGCIFSCAFEIKFRCGRDFSFDQPDTIMGIMFFNGFTKYQINDAIWYTVIVRGVVAKRKVIKLVKEIQRGRYKKSHNLSDKMTEIARRGKSNGQQPKHWQKSWKQRI